MRSHEDPALDYSRENIIRHIRALSFPRRTGSPGNERARAYIIDFFQRHSLEVETQEFSFSVFRIQAISKALPLMIPVLIIFSALIVEARSFLASGLLSVIFIFLAIGTRWSWMSEKIAGRGGSWRSSNVVARIPTAGSTRHIVFMAHYDSKSQTIPITIRIPTLIIFLGLAGIGIILLLMKSTGILSIEREPIIALSVLSSIFLLPHLINLSRNGSPGAIDNASGIGIMLELARVLKEKRGAEMPSFTFVATGAEEEGLIGSLHFMKEHAETFSREKTFFINFDSAGAAGKIVIINTHGIMSHTRSRKLTAELLKISREQHARMVPGILPPGAGVDSFPISYRRFEAVTVSSGTLSTPVLSIHSPADTSSNISSDTIGKIVSCMLALACPETLSQKD